VQYASLNPDPIDAKTLAGHLPPLGQARELLSHFALTVKPNYEVLHIPSIEALMEQTYKSILESGELDVASILLLLSRSL
jgi:hypothetical protein